jgi:hypothetical protein
LALARSARRRGRKVVAVALAGEAEPALAEEVDACAWQPVGSLGAIIRTLARAGVREACFLGGVKKRLWYRQGRPDWIALGVLWRLARREDDQLLRAIADAFERRGIQVVASTPWLPDWTAQAGVLGRRAPTAAERRDLAYGQDVCRALGRLDVGQCVAVRGGVVLALEALEGSDACIERAGALCKSGFAVVKAAKPQQDLRFDVPTVGPRTIAVMRAAGASVLGLQAGRVLVVSPEATVRAADRAGIALYGLGAGDGPGATQASQPSTATG